MTDAEQACAEGRVEVNGRVMKQPLYAVRPGDVVRVDGRPVSLDARTRVLMFHKAADTVTSNNPREGATVFEQLLAALPPQLRGYGWHAIGRLDRDTTGLLLFTNDERVVGHVTQPSSKLGKRYVAKVGARANNGHVGRLREAGAKARLLDDGRVEVEITEGKFHQVKKMLGAVGLPTLELHRDRVGGVELDVPLGAWRELSDEEIVKGLGFSP